MAIDANTPVYVRSIRNTVFIFILHRFFSFCLDVACVRGCGFPFCGCLLIFSIVSISLTSFARRKSRTEKARIAWVLARPGSEGILEITLTLHETISRRTFSFICLCQLYGGPAPGFRFFVQVQLGQYIRLETRLPLYRNR